MRTLRQIPASLSSLAFHALIACLIFLLIRVDPPAPTPLTLEIRELPKKVVLQTAGVRHAPPKTRSSHRLDFLKPTYLSGNLFFTQKSEDEPSVNSGNSGGEALQTPLKVLTAFDHLASQINRNLDFPSMLIEQSVQGTASFDLQFDSLGNVSESESRFSGTHHTIRGLLVKASRLGLIEWYKSDAYRLHKDEFKSQHFRAEFEISYVDGDLSGVSRTGTNSYQFTRRRLKQTCVHPGGVEVICLAMKAKGAVENVLNDNARIKLDLLKDRLDYYDDLGISGINQAIHDS